MQQPDLLDELFGTTPPATPPVAPAAIPPPATQAYVAPEGQPAPQYHAHAMHPPTQAPPQAPAQWAPVVDPPLAVPPQHQHQQAWAPQGPPTPFVPAEAWNQPDQQQHLAPSAPPAPVVGGVPPDQTQDQGQQFGGAGHSVPAVPPAPVALPVPQGPSYPQPQGPGVYSNPAPPAHPPQTATYGQPSVAYPPTSAGTHYSAPNPWGHTGPEGGWAGEAPAAPVEANGAPAPYLPPNPSCNPAPQMATTLQPQLPGTITANQTQGYPTLSPHPYNQEATLPLPTPTPQPAPAPGPGPLGATGAQQESSDRLERIAYLQEKLAALRAGQGAPAIAPTAPPGVAQATGPAPEPSSVGILSDEELARRLQQEEEDEAMARRLHEEASAPPSTQQPTGANPWARPEPHPAASQASTEAQRQMEADEALARSLQQSGGDAPAPGGLPAGGMRAGGSLGVLPQNQWVPDGSATHCMNQRCSKGFGMMSRKHHCRQCGRVFCADCTKWRVNSGLVVDPDGKGPLRTCERCYDESIRQLHASNPSSNSLGGYGHASPWHPPSSLQL